MAEFLDTMEITSTIGRILKNASERVILISPYIDITTRYKELIEEKNEEGIHVTIVWGKKKKQPKFNEEVRDWMKSMEFVKEIFHKDLHAKCYLNEEEAVITSMNLYEASQKNVEMGVLLTKKSDEKAYDLLFKEVKRIVKDDADFKPQKKNSILKKEGFCIRCKDQIKLNPQVPLCKTCYKKWNKYSNPIYQEKFCHNCGKEEKSSLEKPICQSCYKKVQ